MPIVVVPEREIFDNGSGLGRKGCGSGCRDVDRRYRLGDGGTGFVW